MSSRDTSDAPNYYSSTRDELGVELFYRGLSTAGSKSDMIRRLVLDDNRRERRVATPRSATAAGDAGDNGGDASGAVLPSLSAPIPADDASTGGDSQASDADDRSALISWSTKRKDLQLLLAVIRQARKDAAKKQIATQVYAGVISSLVAVLAVVQASTFVAGEEPDTNACDNNSTSSDSSVRDFAFDMIILVLSSSSSLVVVVATICKLEDRVAPLAKLEGEGAAMMAKLAALEFTGPRIPKPDDPMWQDFFALEAKLQSAVGPRRKRRYIGQALAEIEAVRRVRVAEQADKPPDEFAELRELHCTATCASSICWACGPVKAADVSELHAKWPKNCTSSCCEYIVWCYCRPRKKRTTDPAGAEKPTSASVAEAGNASANNGPGKTQDYETKDAPDGDNPNEFAYSSQPRSHSEDELLMPPLQEGIIV